MSAMNSTSFQGYSRSPELLVHERHLEIATRFTKSADEFMDDEQHRLFDYDGHHGVRLDKYFEGDDTVYSVINPAQAVKRFTSKTRMATSVILGGDQRIYAEWHYYTSAESYEDDELRRREINGVVHPMTHTRDWQERIIPVTKAISAGRALLKIVS